MFKKTRLYNIRVVNSVASSNKTEKNHTETLFKFKVERNHEQTKSNDIKPPKGP